MDILLLILVACLGALALALLPDSGVAGLLAKFLGIARRRR